MNPRVVLIISILVSTIVMGITSKYVKSAVDDASHATYTSTMLSSGQQVAAAVQLYLANLSESEKNMPLTTVDKLYPEYLKMLPKMWNLSIPIEDGVLYSLEKPTAEDCNAVNEKNPADAEISPDTVMFGCITKESAKKGYVFYRFTH